MDNSSKKDATIFASDMVGDTVGAVIGGGLGAKYFPAFKARIPFTKMHIGAETVGGHVGGTIGALGGYIAGKRIGNRFFPEGAEMNKAAETRSNMLKQAELLEKVAAYIEELEASVDAASPKRTQLTKVAEEIGLSKEELKYLENAPESVLNKISSINSGENVYGLGMGVGPRLDRADPLTEFILSDF